MTTPITFSPFSETKPSTGSDQEKARSFWLNIKYKTMTAKEIWEAHHNQNVLLLSAKLGKKNNTSDSEKFDETDHTEKNQKEKTKPRKKQIKKDSDDHKPKPIVKKHFIEDPKKTGNDIPTISENQNPTKT